MNELKKLHDDYKDQFIANKIEYTITNNIIDIVVDKRTESARIFIASLSLTGSMVANSYLPEDSAARIDTTAIYTANTP